MEGLKLPKGALEKEKIRAILSRLDMLEKRANESASTLEALIKRIGELEKTDKIDIMNKRIGALEKALEKKK